MRKPILIFVSFLALSFFSCKKESVAPCDCHCVEFINSSVGSTFVMVGLDTGTIQINEGDTVRTCGLTKKFGYAVNYPFNPPANFLDTFIVNGHNRTVIIP